MNDFINKLIDDIHDINPELALKRQTEYNQNFVNKALNEQCNIPVVGITLLKKYMTHVLNCYDFDFISDIDTPWSGVEFTQEEKDALVTLKKEIAESN